MWVISPFPFLSLGDLPVSLAVSVSSPFSVLDSDPQRNLTRLGWKAFKTACRLSSVPRVGTPRLSNLPNTHSLRPPEPSYPTLFSTALPVVDLCDFPRLRRFSLGLQEDKDPNSQHRDFASPIHQTIYGSLAGPNNVTNGPSRPKSLHLPGKIHAVEQPQDVKFEPAI